MWAGGDSRRLARLELLDELRVFRRGDALLERREHRAQIAQIIPDATKSIHRLPPRQVAL